jgi:hypothetical protein
MRPVKRFWIFYEEVKNTLFASLAVLTFSSALAAAAPDHVDITWLSISNIHYEMGLHNILTDGYITRIPQSEFHGGGGGLANTAHAWLPDVNGITRVLNALGGPKKINLLLTGHSHFDHLAEFWKNQL